MDVQLYVYDLSGGVARRMSMQFLGTQIDAVYHTSLVFGGVEYFFGAGVQTCRPGATHHGRPMEIVSLGTTQLPIEIILEYLESLKEVYTPESYDLFAHNCNNFTNDFSTFLVGRGIPDHITSLPQTVLDTPFGQMLRPQIDGAMRGITQAPVPASSVIPRPDLATQYATSPAANGHASANGAPVASLSPGQAVTKSSGTVYHVSTLERLEQLLRHAASSSAVIFFTSSTCAPCRIVYPTYDQLAAETAGKCFLIKVDISNAYEIASKYAVRATPTFITFLKGQQENTWTGASPPQLQGNVRMLVQAAFPPHPHQLLSLPNFRRQSTKPVLYGKIPPLDKLAAKMGPIANDEGVKQALSFISSRAKNAAQEAPLPTQCLESNTFKQVVSKLPQDSKFVGIDLVRIMLVDPRVSGYFVSNPSNLSKLADLFAQAIDGPYNLRLCALQAACNVFSVRKDLLLTSGALLDPRLMSVWLSLLAAGMLDREKPTLRNAAANLAYNLATVQMQCRMAELEAGYVDRPNTALDPSTQIELAAALVEALGAEEEDAEAVRWMVVALARLVYLCPRSEDGTSELLDLCAATDAADVVRAKSKLAAKQDQVLLHEIAQLLPKTSQ